MEFVLEPGLASAIFWMISVAWLAERWWLRSSRAGRTRRGQLELWTILLAMLAAFALSALSHRAGLGVVEGTAGAVIRWMGLLSYGSGVALRLWAGQSLGVWFTRDLEVHDDHELVTHGPYAWMRHPLYVALLLVTLGFGLLFRTPLSALAGVVLVLFALAPRVRREERLLAQHFGSPSLSKDCAVE